MDQGGNKDLQQSKHGTQILSLNKQKYNLNPKMYAYV